jgi:hypothetical protein
MTTNTSMGAEGPSGPRVASHIPHRGIAGGVRVLMVCRPFAAPFLAKNVLMLKPCPSSPAAAPRHRPLFSSGSHSDIHSFAYANSPSQRPSRFSGETRPNWQPTRSAQSYEGNPSSFVPAETSFVLDPSPEERRSERENTSWSSKQTQTTGDGAAHPWGKADP